MRLLRKPGSSLRKDHEAYADMLFGTHPAYLGELLQVAQLRVLETRGTGFFEQIPGMVPLFNRLLKVLPSLVVLVAITEWLADQTLGRLGLLPTAWARLKKAGIAQGLGVDSLLEILACPACRHPNLAETDHQVYCPGCGKTFPKTGRIYDLRVVETLAP